MEGNFGRDTYRSGYAAAPLISSTPVSHNHPLYRPCRIRQDDFCSSTKIAARYTSYGYVGGLAFSSAAWRLEARDNWIGWSDEARQQNLSRVVSNSRFLIVPYVKAPHLASHVLGMVLRRLRADWMERYGEDPVLVETFIEKQRYRGTCYRAANWIEAGETKGRGRQDKDNQRAVAVKKMLLYALDEDARQLLCEAVATVATGIEEPRSKPANADWAEEEFGGARLGDQRLNQRLVTIARDFGANPQAQIDRKSVV